MKEKIDISRLKYSALGTVIFYLAANAFALFNYAPQHDSLNYVTHFTSTWEISLGRFMQPVYEVFREEITVPWMIGIISMICLTAMTYLLTELLEIRRPVMILLSAAFLSANIGHTQLLTTFIYIEDVAMLSALLSCLSVYLIYRATGSKWQILSVIFLVLSLGLYQSFISLAITLVLILYMKELLNNDFSGYKKILQSLCIFFISSVTYFMIEKFAQYLANAAEPTDYHSLSNTLHHLDKLYHQFIIAYGTRVRMFFFRGDLNIGRLGNCLVLVAAIMLVIKIFQEQKVYLKNRIFFVITFAASTLSALMFNIISGLTSYQLSFAIFLYYLLFISLLESRSEVYTKGKNPLEKASAIFLSMVIWSNLIFSNGAYTVQKVIFDRTVSLYTRVLDDMYEIPEYRHNQTPVILLGDYDFEQYSYNISKSDYRDLGSFLNTSVTYPLTVKNLMRYLGENVRLIQDEAAISKMLANPVVGTMPSFPNKGYIRMIDNTLVINF